MNKKFDYAHCSWIWTVFVAITFLQILNDNRVKITIKELVGDQFDEKRKKFQIQIYSYDTWSANIQ